MAACHVQYSLKDRAERLCLDPELAQQEATRLRSVAFARSCTHEFANIQLQAGCVPPSQGAGCSVLKELVPQPPLQGNAKNLSAPWRSFQPRTSGSFGSPGSAGNNCISANENLLAASGKIIRFHTPPSRRCVADRPFEKKPAAKIRPYTSWPGRYSLWESPGDGPTSRVKGDLPTAGGLS